MNIQASDNQTYPPVSNNYRKSGKNIFEGRFQAPISERRVLLMSIDLSIFIIVLILSTMIWNFLVIDIPSDAKDLNSLVFETLANYWEAGLILVFIWHLMAKMSNLYDIPTSYNWLLTVSRIFIAMVPILLLIVASYFFFPKTKFNVLRIGVAALLPVSMILWRTLYIWLSNLVAWNHSMLVIGAGPKAQEIQAAIDRVRPLKYEIIGFVSEDEVSQVSVDSSKVLGTLNNLEGILSKHSINEIVLAGEEKVGSSLFSTLIRSQSLGIRVSQMAELYETIYQRTPTKSIDEAWALNAIQGRRVFSRGQLIFKRLLDLILVVSFLPVIILIVPVAILAIKLTSEGPIFYRQTRVGRGGEHFEILKFRTMFIDSESNGQARWASKDDPRITSVGRLLRKARIDELPQLWNILIGEMSFIGPRPERPQFVKQLRESVDFFDVRLMVKPGLTGWAQIKYEYGNTVEDAMMKLQYDFYYLRHWSLPLDFYILARTIGVVLKLKGL